MQIRHFALFFYLLVFNDGEGAGGNNSNFIFRKKRNKKVRREPNLNKRNTVKKNITEGAEGDEKAQGNSEQVQGIEIQVLLL